MRVKERGEQLQEESHILCLGFHGAIRKLFLIQHVVMNQHTDCGERLWVQKLGSAAPEIYDPFANHLSQLPYRQNRTNIIYPCDMITEGIQPIIYRITRQCQRGFTSSLFLLLLWCLGGKPVYPEQPASSSGFQSGLLPTRQICRRMEGTGKQGLCILVPTAAPCQATERSHCSPLPRVSLVLGGPLPQPLVARFW